jgi:hypothetical protein
MKASFCRGVLIFGICQILSLNAINAQNPLSTAPTSHIEKVRALSAQLRWHDEAGAIRYDAAKEVLTQRLLTELDGFVADSFEADSLTADQVETRLNAVLGYKRGDGLQNVAFWQTFRAVIFLLSVWSYGVEDKRSTMTRSSSALMRSQAAS